ncbi:hypothetical protein [Saccharococcus caldoxylosilyticus]|uniref:hypothetical protein n=1 Tax=Saccharococcus caldoxylosilyticus TaxID=81408 RepID=UPI001FCB9F26|nr:hypothetical protein [Parageobacillus caldoxylosilyticus]BDG37554.1 hypothetical protein PcaKH15_34600 [Parageobacillus caldoxylosilyticus]BDG41345.1 hypothetical protein PcaKH16_34840 [Parageobacillus caldoxylosilyticus]
MSHIDWFVRIMKRTFNVAVNIDEVGYEAYEFYHEELNNYLVPEEHLEKLPNPLLFGSIDVREQIRIRMDIRSDRR